MALPLLRFQCSKFTGSSNIQLAQNTKLCQLVLISWYSLVTYAFAKANNYWILRQLTTYSSPDRPCKNAVLEDLGFKDLQVHHYIYHEDWKKAILLMVLDLIFSTDPYLEVGIEDNRLCYRISQQKASHLDAQKAYLACPSRPLKNIKYEVTTGDSDLGKGCTRIIKNIDLARSRLDVFTLKNGYLSERLQVILIASWHNFIILLLLNKVVSFNEFSFSPQTR